MARTIYKNGKKITLLNPAEKGRKAAAELKVGLRVTNDKKIKRDKNDNAIQLTDTQRAWRGGYLAARKDSANCYNAKMGKKKKTKNVGDLPAIY